MNWQTPERVPRKPPPDKSDAPRIIVQYRAKRGKMYELQSPGGVVAVCIAQNQDTDAPSGWLVDAQSPAAQGASVIEGRGTSAAEALQEVARAWKAHSPALTVFDWEAIARELHVVHAI